jgi:hypothetical protein
LEGFETEHIGVASGVVVVATTVVLHDHIEAAVGHVDASKPADGVPDVDVTGLLGQSREHEHESHVRLARGFSPLAHMAECASRQVDPVGMSSRGRTQIRQPDPL